MQNKAVHLSTERKYRKDFLHNNNEQQIYIQIAESDLLILLTNKISKEEAVDFFSKKLLKIRQEIESYSIVNKEFITSLIPLKNELSNVDIIDDMLIAGKLLEVGPFAAVAGSVSEYIAKAGYEFLKNKNLPTDIIVENGGDIFLISSKERVVALLDKPNDKTMLGIKVQATNGLAICTSSATIGHSLSFGKAELLTVLAQKGSIADAAATSFCNMVQTSADFQNVLSRVQNAKGYEILGLVGSCDDELFAFGDIELTLI